MAGTNGTMAGATAGAISQRAMLVALSISVWTARRHDRRVDGEVAGNHGASVDAGRYNKRLVRKGAAAYEGIIKVANAARQWMYSQTLPWGQEGTRILPAASYLEFQTMMRRYEAQFQAAVADFLVEYPNLLTDAQAMAGSLWRADDYPPASELPGRFGFRIAVLPFPEAGDFRVALGESELVAVRAQIEADVAATMAMATAEVWERLREVVGRMRERLADPKAIFRDSLVGNIRELCELVPRLNITGDAGLQAMATEISRELGRFEPAELRESAEARLATAQAARQIEAKMAGLFGQASASAS